MMFFRAVKMVNVLYVVGIVAIAIFNNVIQANPESSVQNRLIVISAVLLISIPNMLSIVAITPRLKLAKTAIVLNVVCISLLGAGLAAYEQERLALGWAATVISICVMNVAVLIAALVHRRDAQSGDDNVVYP